MAAVVVMMTQAMVVKVHVVHYVEGPISHATVPVRTTEQNVVGIVVTPLIVLMTVIS